MIPAIILFAATYVLMLVFSKYRPYIALASGLIQIARNSDRKILCGKYNLFIYHHITPYAKKIQISAIIYM